MDDFVVNPKPNHFLDFIDDTDSYDGLVNKPINPLEPFHVGRIDKKEKIIIW
jgi:hypothetical protein